MNFYLGRFKLSLEEFKLKLHDRSHPIRPIWGFRLIWYIFLAALYWLNEEPRLIAIGVAILYAIGFVLTGFRWSWKWIRGKLDAREAVRDQEKVSTVFSR